VSTAQRSPALPGVRPAADKASITRHQLVRVRVPQGHTEGSHRHSAEDVLRALAAPDVREKLAAQGAEPSTSLPANSPASQGTRRWSSSSRERQAFPSRRRRERPEDVLAQSVDGFLRCALGEREPETSW